MKGINIADLSDREYRSYLNEAVSSDVKRECVFISHKKEDEAAAEAVGKLITEKLGVNIFLDKYNRNLQYATVMNDDKALVKEIQKGLNASSHLLCIISDKTQFSWWVPYEIGYADMLKLCIASVKLKRIDDVPSFLKVHKYIKCASELEDYLFSLSSEPRGFELINENYVITELDKYS